MKPVYRAAVFAALAAALGLGWALHRARTPALTSPLYGVALPEDYRDWPLVAPAEEAAPLDELRVVVGNPVAMRAYRDGVRPFPDGAVLVKRAWKRDASPDFATATIPGNATTVQVMVKDSRRYAATGGWGYGRFVDGRPADEAQHRTCAACHASRVRQRDYVFTNYAP
ncbi:hypothetical protein GGR77_000158 [Xanthomonas translucens]